MAIRTLNPNKVYTYQEVEHALDHAPHVLGMRQSGSHKTWEGPHGIVTAPVGHRGDMKRGLCRAVALAAAAAGLFLLLLAFAPQLISLAHLGG